MGASGTDPSVCRQPNATASRQPCCCGHSSHGSVAPVWASNLLPPPRFYNILGQGYQVRREVTQATAPVPAGSAHNDGAGHGERLAGGGKRVPLPTTFPTLLPLCACPQDFPFEGKAGFSAASSKPWAALLWQLDEAGGLNKGAIELTPEVLTLNNDWTLRVRDFEVPLTTKVWGERMTPLEGGTRRPLQPLRQHATPAVQSVRHASSADHRGPPLRRWASRTLANPMLMSRCTN